MSTDRKNARNFAATAAIALALLAGPAALAGGSIAQSLGSGNTSGYQGPSDAGVPGNPGNTIGDLDAAR
jgi:hypothetical protein